MRLIECFRKDVPVTGLRGDREEAVKVGCVGSHLNAETGDHGYRGLVQNMNGAKEKHLDSVEESGIGEDTS